MSTKRTIHGELLFGVLCVLSGCTYSPEIDMQGSFLLEMIMPASVTVVEMTTCSSINQIALNCARGLSTHWDADFLDSIGVDLSTDQYFKIANGLTTVDDVDPIWDSAFFSGVI